MNINLYELENVNCTRCKSDERKLNTEDFICSKTMSVSDGLPLRCVGGWGRDKIFFLVNEFNIFMPGMQKKWGGNIAYFEIGSGPGRCIDRNSGFEFDGTALAIIKTRTFDNVKYAVFIDIDHEVVDNLNKRIRALKKESKAEAIIGDYTNGKGIAEVIRTKNHKGLNLVFIDPTDCSVPFSTIIEIKNAGIKFDLVINVATKSDFNRNIFFALSNKDSDVRKKYENFLGDLEYFNRPEILEYCMQKNYDYVRKEFIKKYLDMLKKIGFRYFGRKEIHGLYELVFASEHSLGLKFWDNAVNRISITGQRNLFL
jgi:three-Cys-motif partner protein